MPIEFEITSESHLDHEMTEEQREWALKELEEGRAAIKIFAESDSVTCAVVTLPERLGTVPCALRGPTVGDGPITGGVFWKRRLGRSWPSRLCGLPLTTSRLVSMVVVDGVLATIYGGPIAPREVFDPDLPKSSDSAIEYSLQFWSEHVLSDDSFGGTYVEEGKG